MIYAFGECELDEELFQVRRRGDVVGIGAGRQLIERHLRRARGLRRTCREYQRRESEKADHGCLSIWRVRHRG